MEGLLFGFTLESMVGVPQNKGAVVKGPRFVISFEISGLRAYSEHNKVNSINLQCFKTPVNKIVEIGILYL